MKIEIKAEPRSLQGTGASRRLRRTDKVPGVLYGAGKDAVAIQLDHKELFFNLKREAFHASILDLAVGDEKARSLTVYVNDGRGRLTPGFSITDPVKTPYAMTVGDLNGDGHPDIVFGYTEGPHAVFFNDGTGRQFRKVTFGDKAGSAYGFALGDVNGDKVIDIAVARSGAPNVLYLGSK